MKNLGYKLAAGAASAAMLAATMAPPVFAGSLEISGNGADSNNAINVDEDCTTVLRQKNKSRVGVKANLGSNSGNNSANANTGSDVDVDSGDATSDAIVTVEAGGNVAEDTPDCCDCLGNGDSDQAIKGNGEDSRNRIRTSKSLTNITSQTNISRIGVSALLRPRTGRNTANRNTGGSVEVDSGHSTSIFDAFVRTHRNILR